MPMGRPIPPINLTPEEREQLEALAATHSLPQNLATRVRIILLADKGKANQDIAQELRVDPDTVTKWRGRFLEKRLEGLHDQLRPGRPRSISDRKIAALVYKTLKSKPRHETHWSSRTLAAEAKVSDSTVCRVWRAFGILDGGSGLELCR